MEGPNSSKKSPNDKKTAQSGHTAMPDPFYLEAEVKTATCPGGKQFPNAQREELLTSPG